MIASHERMRMERVAEVLEMTFRLRPTLPVLAIRWMHLKHPLHEVQHALLHGTTVKRKRLLLLRRLLQSVVYAMYLSGRLLALHLSLRRQKTAMVREQFDLIAKTCCFWPGRPAGEADFYFGDLAQRLALRGLRMLLLCGNVVGGSWRAFAKAHIAATPQARCPELVLVHPSVPFRFLCRQLMTCLRLRGMVRHLHDPLLQRVVRLASDDCLAPDTARSALCFWVGKATASLWHPNAVVMLYEGQAWERCLTWGIRSVAPEVRVVGYQHTTMFPESVSQFRPSLVKRELLPDVVLCLGEVTRGLMQEGHERYGARLIPFGSVRYRAAPVSRPPQPSRRTVLVTPEGLLSEVKALFEFAFACAKRLPAYTFILRCHPESPMTQVRRLLAPHLATTPNLIFSEGRPIEDDCARASVLLYRGSSSVIYAVLQGLLPLYLHGPTLDERDPLFQLSGWRRRCGTPEEFAAQLAAYETTSEDARQATWREAAAYAAEYTGPVTEDRLAAFLEAVRLVPHASSATTIAAPSSTCPA